MKVRKKTTFSWLLLPLLLVLMASQAHGQAYQDKSLTTEMEGVGFSTPKDAATLDYNNDGRKDLLIGTSNKAWKQIFPIGGNNVPRFFHDIVPFSGITLPTGNRGLIQADYDNDGWIDIYVPSPDGHRLYRNNQGVFEDVTSTIAGFNHPDYNETIGAAWGDYNGDGDLDILLLLDRFGTQLEPYEMSGSASQVLLQNNLDFNTKVVSFENKSAWNGIQGYEGVNSAVWGNLNGGEGLDLILIANGPANGPEGFQESRYFAYNDSLNRLEDVTNDAFNADLLSELCTLAKLADVDSDGKLDLFFISKDGPGFYTTEPYAGYSYKKLEFAWQANNLRQDSVQDLAIVDYNLDGHMDVMCGMGNNSFSASVGVSILENNGAVPYFCNQEQGIPVSLLAVGGFATADFVSDGYTEIFLSLDSTKPFFQKFIDNDPPPSRKWIGIKLRSVNGENNYYGIGATVIARAAGYQVAQIVDGGASGKTQNDLDLIYGMTGVAGNTADIEILWPDGRTQLVDDLVVNQTHTIYQDYEPGVNSLTIQDNIIYNYDDSMTWKFTWWTNQWTEKDRDKVRFNVDGLGYKCMPLHSVLEQGTNDVTIDDLFEESNGTFKHVLTWTNAACLPRCTIPFVVESAVTGCSDTSDEQDIRITFCASSN